MGGKMGGEMGLKLEDNAATSCASLAGMQSQLWRLPDLHAEKH